MTVSLKGRTHLSFKPMQAIYNLISEKITDINAVRRALPTSRERQWIYPSFPDANDEKYPRIAILNNNARFSEYGSGQFVDYERGVTNKVEHMVFAKVATIPITIAIFVKKRQMHSVDYYNGTAHSIKNTKQADFIGEKIAKFLEMFRTEYFIPFNMDLKVLGVTASYDDNSFLIGKNIEAEIVMLDEWEVDMTDLTATARPIENIDMTITA